MTDAVAAPAPRKLDATAWLICIIASIGFAFDIFVLLMAPLIGGPALAELLGEPPGSERISDWIGYIFWASAMAGGFFGLIGGYLTDRFGRRRILVWSILLYAFSTLAAGFSTSVWMLLFLRCTTFIGVCVEFVAAVAWLAELFPNPKQRETVLGYTQAFSSVGGLLVTVASVLCVRYASSLPEILGGHAAWRYTLISGVIPAIPLIIIRPFLPESPEWKEKRERGTLRRPSIAELFRPAYRRTSIVTALLFACSYGAAFGAIQLTPPQIVPGFKEVAEARQKALAALAEAKPIREQLKALPADSPERKALGGKLAEKMKSWRELDEQAKQEPNKVQFYQETGGLVGRFVLAFLAVRIVSRRRLLRIFQVPGLLIIPLVFFYPAKHDLELLKWGMAAAGFFTVAQFSFWGNYLPRVYPVHLRGTGESFAANVGGRMLGTSAAFFSTQLMKVMPGDSKFVQMANACAAMALFVYLAGLVLTSFLPEPEALAPGDKDGGAGAE